MQRKTSTIESPEVADLTEQKSQSPVTIHVEQVKSSYTLDELKKIPDYLEQQTLHNKYARHIIPFGNLDMLGDLSAREKDVVFNPTGGEWTFEKNMAFMAAAIQRGRTFRLVTPLASYQNHCDNETLSGTMCEMLLLLDHGYATKPHQGNPTQTIFYCLENQEEKRQQPFVNYFLDISIDGQPVKKAGIERIQNLINVNKAQVRDVSQIRDWRRPEVDQPQNKPLALESVPLKPFFAKKGGMRSYGDGLNGQERPSSNRDWRARTDDPKPKPGSKNNN